MFTRHPFIAGLAPDQTRFRGSRRQRNAGRRRRRGVSSLFLVVFLPVAIAGIALVLNWIYLVLVHRNMQQRTDLVAVVAVAQLLDEDLLADAPLPDQSDDVPHAEADVEAFLGMNNDVGPATLQLQMTDVTVTPGFVDNLSQHVADANFDTNPPADVPYNTLCIEAQRLATGSNPVALFMKSFGFSEPVTVRCGSYATLDGRLVGFRPTDRAPSPVVPLALSADAWDNQRITDAANSNGRMELYATLAPTSGQGPPANAALVAFREIAGDLVNASLLGDQIVEGIYPDNLPGPTHQLGPVWPDALPLPATQSISVAGVAALANDFNEVIASDDPRRIFPLYESVGSGQAAIVGFVAADVLLATDVAVPGGQNGRQLTVVIEPVFIVHFTAWTDPAAPENIYIHKIRLSR